jgi:hypothetical protein
MQPDWNKYNSVRFLKAVSLVQINCRKKTVSVPMEAETDPRVNFHLERLKKRGFAIQLSIS